MITQVRVGFKYVNISVAITNDEGVAFDPTSAEAWFYKVSQINGAITLDTNINVTGKLGLSKQDGQIGFYGASIDISSFTETEYVILYKVTTSFAETITVEYLSIDSSKYLIADIWNYATRTLTSFGTLVSDIWNYTTRTLTSFGTLVSDIAQAVWNYTIRTITSGGITASEIWSYITRTLTAGTKDIEIDAIKIETDKIQPEIINKKDEYKADISNLATSTSIITLETLIKRILGLTQENFRVIDPTYDVNHNLTSSTIKIYPTASDCENDINKIAEYQMIASYNLENECTSYKVKKV